MDEPTRSLPSIDPRYLVNVLIELQVAVRKLALYSFSHTIVPSLLENLEKQFNALFEHVEGMSFGITRHELLYQGGALANRNPVIHELARGLNQFGLAGITFSKGLTKDEILKFLKLLVEGRAQPPEQKEQMISHLHQEVPSIQLKLIRFGEALKNHRETADPAQREKKEEGEKELWRGLVKQLMEESSEGGHPMSNIDPEEKAHLENLADLINRLCRGNDSGPQNYERTIVRYLNDQAESHVLTSEQRMHLYGELSKLLSNLDPKVREQIFRISVEQTETGGAALDELLDFLPEPMLMEVLNEIQLSNQNISAPMLSLLNKFTDLSVQDKKIEELLASKLQNHQDLFQELLTNRANRVYYPSSYRSLLDQELTFQKTDKEFSSGPEMSEINPEVVNHHLALVILELLDAPIGSQPQYETLIQQMNRLLTVGLGDRTHAVLQETLLLLFQKLKSVDQEHRPFLQREIKNFIKPEVLTGLLQTYRVQGDERIGDLLGQMRELAGAEVIPILLDLLEVEENLSVRKRLLQWIVQCGTAVIPLAVQRLTNPKWYVVRNMLVLLKDLGAKEALPEIVRCLQQDSSKLRMAALQAIEALGKGTDSFYRALSIAFRDSDPGVFRKVVSMMLSQQDPRALEMITARFQYSSGLIMDGRLITVLEMIRKSRAREFIPSLVKLRRQLRLRFWQWNRTRPLYKAVNHTVRELHSGERNYAGPRSV